MAETEIVKEDNSNDVMPFAPSLFTQAVSTAQGEVNKPSADGLNIQYEPEDLEGIFTMPFDAAAFITKVKDLELNEKELKQLTRIWLKPFAKLNEKYPQFPWIVCCTVTMGIVVEKFLIYYIAQAEKEKVRKKTLESADSKAGAKAEEAGKG